ncbi:MAG: glycosyltransferase family 39 protein [Fibrobacteres bacterium]|nr:glycosyltransferase family 39 protein [Fibrobacterota bacterium]
MIRHFTEDNRLLAVIIILAAILRLWSLNWGEPPQIAYADELYHVEQSVGVFYDPHRIFHEPYTPLFHRAVSIAMLPVFALNHSEGKEKWERPAAWHFYLGRVLSALFDLFAIVVTFLLAQKLFNSRKVAITATLIHTLCFECIRHSHYMTPDTLSVLMSSLTLLLLYKLWDDSDKLSLLALAGIAAGLAVAAKFNNVLLLLSAVYVILFSVNQNPFVNRFKSLMFFLGIFAVSLMISFPAFGVFLKEVVFANKSAASGAAFKLSCEGGPFAIFLHNYPIPHEELSFRSIWSAMGILPVLLGITGAVYLVRKDFRKFTPLVVYAVLTIVPAAKLNIIRYAMPAFPLFAIFGAFIVVKAMSSIKKPAAIFFVALLFSPPLIRAVQLDFLLSHKDSRVIAGEWMRKNIEKGSVVALYTGHMWANPDVYGYGYRFIDIPLVLYEREGLSEDRAKPLDYYRKAGVEYVAVNSYTMNHHLNSVSRRYFPETVSSFEKFYKELADNAQLIFYYEKNNFTKPGPSIKIYRLN